MPEPWTLTDDPFRPWTAFSGATLQTVVAALPVWATALSSERWRLPLPGEGSLHLHVNLRPERAPLVLLVHGIGGSSQSVYVRRAAEALLEAGFHVARVDLRGAGASLVDAPSLYHAGLTSDLVVATEALAKEPRVESVSLLGFSLGGNLVLKLAGEWGGDVPPFVRAVAALSPVVDLGPASLAFERKRSWPYRLYVVRKLVDMARAFAKQHPRRASELQLQLERISHWSTVRAYDESIVVPMHGFADAHDYYARASSGPGLARIGVPTFVAFAADDPMIPARTVIPWLESASPAVSVAWTARGGHVGGYETITREGFVRTWPVRRAISFLQTRR